MVGWSLVHVTSYLSLFCGFAEFLGAAFRVTLAGVRPDRGGAVGHGRRLADTGQLRRGRQGDSESVGACRSWLSAAWHSDGQQQGGNGYGGLQGSAHGAYGHW